MFYPSPQTRLYFHDNNGHPLSGGSVSTYLSASSLPIQTAKDFKGKVKNPTTVPLDERGEAVVFLSPGVVYRFVVKDSLGATVLDQDGISLPISGSDSGVPYEFKSADGSVLISATTEDGLVSYDFSIAPLVSRVEELSSEVSSRYESLHHDIQTVESNRNLVETALWDEVYNLRNNEILCVNIDDTTITYGTLANRKAVLLVGSNGCSIGYLGSLSTSAANFYAFMPKQQGTYKANENVMYTFDFSTKEWSTTFGPADWSFFIFNYNSAITFSDLMSKLGPGGTCVLQISSYNFAWMQNIDFTGKGATWVRKTANAMEYYYLSTAGVWSMESVADIDSAIIPTDASSTNQLATKAYADAIGERLEARYLGYNEQGYPFPTHAALTSATTYYYQGAAVSPDTNDITTVTADEDHIGMTGEASTTRYRWNGTGWAFEYVINNTGLSESQLMAVNSGITPAKVSAYDGLQANIDTKQDRLTFDTAPTANSTNPVTSGGVKAALETKQDKLTAGEGISISGTTISNTYGVTRTRVDQITDDLLIYISPFYPKSEPRVYDMAWSFCLQFIEVFKISFSGLVLKTDTAIDVFVSGVGGEAIDSSITRVSQMSQKLRVAFVTDTADKVALAVYLTGEVPGVRATYFYGWLGEPVAGTICKTPTPFNKSDYGTFKDITINLKTMYDSCASNAKVDAKQDKLTFDTAPTANSTNPVTSGGVKAALDKKQDKLTAGQGISLSGTTISNTYGLTRTRIDNLTDDRLIFISGFYSESSTSVSDMAWSFFLQYGHPYKISFNGSVSKTATAIDLYVSGMAGEAVDATTRSVRVICQKLRVAFVTNTKGDVALAVYLDGAVAGSAWTYFYGWLADPVFGSLYRTPIPFNKSDYGTFQDLTINLKSMYDFCASNAKVDAKQDKLTFDTTPTADSTNPVTSGGVKAALETKQDKLTNTDAQIKTAVSNAHAHSNKTVLDGITSTKVAEWNESLKAVMRSEYINSGGAPSYGVYVGGCSFVGAWSKCICTFLLSTSSDPDMTAHTYIGTFTFRHGVVLNYELKCLTGVPKNPMRIVIVHTKNSNSTYDVNLFLIPSDAAASTYTVHRLTCICAANFTWACRAATAEEYAAVDNDNAKRALMPVRLFFDGGGSNVTTTGGSWLPTFNSGTLSKCRGIVDLSVHVDLSVINQTTYISTLASYDITLVNSSGTDILPSSYHQTGRMPRPPKGSVAAGGTVDISHTHRFVFPITASNNLLAGWRPKITLPSNYTLDSSAQVNISATCSGIVLPYYYSDTSF